MKLTGLILPLLIVFPSPFFAQYYFTGEVKDLHGDKLQRVAIVVRSTGLVYLTGRYGDFEITSKKADDSLTFAYNGYQQYTTACTSTDFLRVTLKRLTAPSAPKNRLTSLIGWQGCDPYPEHAGDKSFGVVENPFLEGEAMMSFVGNPNGVSYNNIRRFLEMRKVVPPEAVKIEEMMGYFNFHYEEPDPDETFHCRSDLITCPWNKDHRLLCLSVNAQKGELRRIPPAHLVFVIDASGSMDMPNKLPLIKSGMRLLVRNLRDVDTVSIIQYGTNLSVMAGIPGSRKGDIIRALEQLRADGETPGEAALKLAYQVARDQYIKNGNNRVILITDGDVSNEQKRAVELADLVEEQAEAGITLSCLGVGLTPGENSELPVLAEKGKGNFACMDDEQEGERLFLKELDPHLPDLADSVSITATFDSTLVSNYRLIGYDNKRNLLADTALRLEGSTVGSAHSMVALFELIPNRDFPAIERIARMRVNYCLPGMRSFRTKIYDCPNRPMPFEQADLQLKKAACIALFGMKLKNSDYVGPIGWAEVEKMARKVFVGNNFIDREYINLVARAREIYDHNHK